MTEFVVMGLLPNIAADLLPSVWASSQEEALSQAGWLISLYALGVVIGAPTIAGFVARYPRHRVMIVLALALTVFNALTVVLPTFELVGCLASSPGSRTARISASVRSSPPTMGPGNRAKGVAFILTGLTVANVIGVPLGTFLGQAWGWRAAFAVVALVFALATVFIALFVPAHPGNPGRTMRAELGVFRIGQVWFTLGVGAIGFGGFFAVYSYIAPLVTEVAGSPDWVVPIVLVLMGLGMTGGNLVGGHLADIDLRRTLLLGLAAMAVVFALLAVLSFWIVSLSLVVVLVGFVSSVLSPTIQTRLMDVAGDNQSIAAAMNHSALNIGNSLGAFLGGIVIAVGWGFTAPAWTGAVLAVAGLLIALVSYRVEARRVAQTPVLAS